MVVVVVGLSWPGFVFDLFLPIKCLVSNPKV